MEWRSVSQEEEIRVVIQNENENGVESDGLFVKVMTDDQMEILRKQIAMYSMICEQLVEMHKLFSAQHDVRMGNPYFDLLMPSGIQKSSRQRWTPTPEQLQILERVYEKCTGTPSKQKIQEISTQLAQHGHISETNVYNWFQNRRARIKRRQSSSGLVTITSESEPENKPESFQNFGIEQMIGEHLSMFEKKYMN